MHRTCIALVDAARARILTIERIVDATGVRDELVEHEDLRRPTRRAERHTVPGSLFAARGGKAYAHAALPGELARAIVRRLAVHTADPRVTTLIVCASPHLLTALRHHTGALHRPHLAIHELANDLIDLAPPQLQAQLALHGVDQPGVER